STVCDRPVSILLKRTPPPFGGWGRGSASRLGLFEQWIGKCGDQLDQVRLTIDAGLAVILVEMGPNRGLRDTKSLGHLGNTTDFDNCEQYPQFHRCEV